MGTAEFSDMPMPRPPADETYNDTFKAKYVKQYLEAYVDHHDFAGRSLRDRIQFEFEVRDIKKADGRWLISGGAGPNKTQQLVASKLMVASGLMSVPNLPDLPGRERFEGLVVHQEGFGQSSVLASANIHHVTVLGAGKSAADMVYASAKAGKSVSWVIRASGTGPGHFLSPVGKGPYRNAIDMMSTRWAASLSPSLFHSDTWFTRFLHATSFGAKLLELFWSGFENETRQIANYCRPDALAGFDKLQPHTPFFWQNGTGGLLNRPDFWDVVAHKVHVYVDDILELDKRVVRLKNGGEISTDVLLCGTGWQASPGFFDRDTAIQLGLPHSFDDEPAEEAKLWARLEREADQHIMRRFPHLAHPPAHAETPVRTTPYRLYNGIAPLHDDHSIVFIGYALVFNYFRLAESQALWATAHLDGRLALPSLAARQEEVALFNAYCRRRYLSNGRLGTWLFFDIMGYTDRLLAQLGLSSHRRSGWFSDFCKPNPPSDLVGLWDEYMAKYGAEEVKEGRRVGGGGEGDE